MTLVPAAAWAGELQVTVTNVRNDAGHVHVAVCTQNTFLTEECPIHATAAAQPGATVVVVPNAPPGTWAVQVFHDENDNEATDMNLMGIPTEGVGFSNNPSFKFGPPRWSDALFQLGEEGGRITLRLRYFH